MIAAANNSDGRGVLMERCCVERSLDDVGVVPSRTTCFGTLNRFDHLSRGVDLRAGEGVLCDA